MKPLTLIFNANQSVEPSRQPVNNHLARWCLLTGIILTIILFAHSRAKAQDDDYLRLARLIDLAELGIREPSGLAFAPQSQIFFIFTAKPVNGASGGQANLFMIMAGRNKVYPEQIPVDTADPINITYDDHADRLLIWETATQALVQITVKSDGSLDMASLTRISGQPFGLQQPQGMAIDPATGHLFILDKVGPRLVRLEPGPNNSLAAATISTVDLSQAGLSDVSGLAFNPTSGHLFLVNMLDQTLHEFTPTGQTISIRNLADLNLGRSQGLVFAPTGDQTDNPAAMGLYLVDTPLKDEPQGTFRIYLPLIVRGSTGGGTPPVTSSGQIVELSFNRPTPPAGPVIASTLIQTIQTSQFSPPSPDPAGITYLAGIDNLLISDSEVNEMSIFQGVNLFRTTRQGTLVDTLTTIGFSEEPTGVTVNPNNGHLFFTDDNAQTIIELNPGSDGAYNTSDDVITTIDTVTFNSLDPEGITFDSEQGVLFMADSLNAEVYRISPGTNGLFDGLSPAGDDQITSFDTESLGMIQLQGIAFNPLNGNLMLAGWPRNRLLEVTRSGDYVRAINISDAMPTIPGGLVYAPPSVSNPPNFSTLNLYVVDRGVDNGADPNENDGRVYEIEIPPVNQPPTVNAGPDQTVTWPTIVTLNGTATDDGLPNPPGNLSTTWNVISGPGIVTFADPSKLNTTANLSTIGRYVLNLSANDSVLTGTDTLTVTVQAPNNPFIDVQIAASSDDAEEGEAGNIKLISSDLEMVQNGGENQVVGLRFPGINIPVGAVINNAYIQFYADEILSVPTDLTIHGEAIDDAPAFANSLHNISARLRTTAAVSWTPAPWISKDVAGPDQRTPNLAPVIQEIMNRPGWSGGNALALIITGTGERAAKSYDGDPSGAPSLYISFSVPTAPPVITTFTPLTGPRGATVTIAGNNLLGLSQVSFNGQSAGFQVISATQVQAVVPFSATTGLISITNQLGTATSSQPFTVITTSAVLVGAGDIARCDKTEDEETAKLLDQVPGTVFTLGDNAYPDGTTAEFNNCYAPTWGRHKARTRPATGNHEYHTTDAAPYFNYFGAVAGNIGEGYYSYDLGSWHIIVLNTECNDIGGCDPDSSQGQWLQADLVANSAACTLAYWHKPRFSSGNHGNNSAGRHFWQILYDAGADLILSGHDHHYERFAPQDPDGVADAAQGLRQFVVGTGGTNLTALSAVQPNSEVRNFDTHGVLKLTLHPTGYDWEFIPITGQTFTDTGSDLCH